MNSPPTPEMSFSPLARIDSALDALLLSYEIGLSALSDLRSRAMLEISISGEGDLSPRLFLVVGVESAGRVFIVAAARFSHPGKLCRRA